MADRKKEKERYSRIFAVFLITGFAILVAGLIVLFSNLKSYKSYLQEYQKKNIELLIDSVDISLNNQVTIIKNNLGNLIDRTKIATLEESAKESKDCDELLDRIEDIILSGNHNTDYVAAYYEDSYWFSNFDHAETLRKTGSEESDIAYFEVGEDCYVGIGTTSKGGVTYYVMFDVLSYLREVIPPEQMVANWIVLYDSSNGIFFQSHDNGQPMFLQLDAKALEERNDGYTMMAKSAEAGQLSWDYYEYPNYSGEYVTNCLVTKPVEQCRNEWFTIGAAQGLSFMNDIIGHTNTLLLTSGLPILGLLLIAVGLFMMGLMRQEQSEKYRELEAEKDMLRLKNELSAQLMQPHFLFNALSAIREVILEDPEQASDLVYNFTIHLRNCIHTLDRDCLVTVEEEIKNIQAYVEIERIRQYHQFNVVFDIKEKDHMLPPLILQPFVENAIRHGISKLRNDSGEIRITDENDGNHYIIRICDNGAGFDPSKEEPASDDKNHRSTGIRNASQRIKSTLNGEVKINSSVGQGTEVVITIPVE